MQNTPEPLFLIIPPSLFYRHIQADESRVLLLGHGVDVGLTVWMPTVVQMLKTMPPRDVAVDIMRSLRMLHRRPPFGLGIRDWLAMRGRPPVQSQPFPTWINDDFARRVDLRQRWDEIQRLLTQGPDARRERARAEYISGREVAFHEWWDAGVTRLPLEVRFPYLDRRLVEYFLALPPLPWGDHKLLLRLAMRERLPERVLRRPKTNLSTNPMFALLSDDRLPRESLLQFDELRPYVDVDAFVREPPTPHQGWALPPVPHLLAMGLRLRHVQER